MTYFQIENRSHAILLSSLHLWYGENSGKEALGVPRDLLYGTQLQHHQDVLLHSGVYATDLLDNSNEFVKNMGGVGFSRLLRLQVAGLP